MLLKCGRSAVRSMVSVCSHSGANNIRSSVLVGANNIRCAHRACASSGLGHVMAPRISVGLQSQRGQQYQVERAGGVGVLVELQSVCSAVNGVGLQSQRVGLQSQREAVNGVGLRAGGVGLGGGPTISGRACWWSWTWRRNIRGSMVLVCSHSERRYLRLLTSVLVGPTISGRACWWGQQYQVERAGGANNIKSSVLVGPTISGRCNGTAHK